MLPAPAKSRMQDRARINVAQERQVAVGEGLTSGDGETEVTIFAYLAWRCRGGGEGDNDAIHGKCSCSTRVVRRYSILQQGRTAHKREGKSHRSIWIWSIACMESGLCKWWHEGGGARKTGLALSVVGYTHLAAMTGENTPTDQDIPASAERAAGASNSKHGWTHPICTSSIPSLLQLQSQSLGPEPSRTDKYSATTDVVNIQTGHGEAGGILRNMAALSAVTYLSLSPDRVENVKRVRPLSSAWSAKCHLYNAGIGHHTRGPPERRADLLEPSPRGKGS